MKFYQIQSWKSRAPSLGATTIIIVISVNRHDLLPIFSHTSEKHKSMDDPRFVVHFPCCFACSRFTRWPRTINRALLLVVVFINIFYRNNCLEWTFGIHDHWPITRLNLIFNECFSLKSHLIGNKTIVLRFEKKIAVYLHLILKIEWMNRTFLLNVLTLASSHFA